MQPGIAFLLGTAMPTEDGPTRGKRTPAQGERRRKSPKGLRPNDRDISIRFVSDEALLSLCYGEDLKLIECNKDSLLPPKLQVKLGAPAPYEFSGLLARARDTGQPVIFELRTDSLVYSFLAIYMPEAHCINLYGRDITAECEARQALQESEERLHVFFDYSPDAYALIDADGRFIGANRAAVELTGYSKEESSGQSVIDLNLIPPEETPRGQNLIKRALRGEPIGPERMSLIRKDGRRVSIEVYAHTVNVRERQFILVTARDITHIINAEKALRDANDILERFYENTHILIAYLDKDFNFIRVNRAYAERESKPQEYFVGKNHFELYPSEENQRIFESVIKTGQPYYTFAKPFVYPNHPELGMTYWDWSVQPVKSPDGSVEGLILCLLDATEEQKAVRALEYSRQQMRALAARVELAREEERTRISHQVQDELGQMLTGLRMDIAWLERKTGAPTSPEDRTALELKMQAMSNSVRSAIEAMRKISRALRPSALDLGLGAALEWQAEDFERRTGIPCQVQVSSDVGGISERAAIALFRISQEALTNVARHAEATRAEITLARQKGGLKMEVKDNGKGIAEKHLKQTYSLGIVGMRERALALGGEVVISSNGLDGKGTNVMVIIPQLNTEHLE